MLINADLQGKRQKAKEKTNREHLRDPRPY